jgi:PIN domain nuclease of toxin-antitoxin system
MFLNIDKRNNYDGLNIVSFTELMIKNSRKKIKIFRNKTEYWKLAKKQEKKQNSWIKKAILQLFH